MPWGHAHGMEGEVGNTRPRNHQVAAFLDEDDALEIEKFEQVANVFLRGKGLVRRRSTLLLPVLVVGLGVLGAPAIGI